MAKGCSTSLQKFVSSTLAGEPSSAIDMMVALLLQQRQGKKVERQKNPSKYKMTLEAYRAGQDTQALHRLGLIEFIKDEEESQGVISLTQAGIQLGG